MWRRLAAALGLARELRASGHPPVEQPMKLVVGLGNYGREYVGTRHNVGYEVIDRLAERYGAARFRRQFQGRLAGVEIGTEKVWLLKPETYMNLSGRSVQPALAFHRLTAERLLVVCDDFNLPLGKIRVRRRGSDGGQKGLRSISQHLATTDYPRLRIGIGPVPARRDATDYVLERFKPQEREPIEQAIEQSVDAVVVWCQSTIEDCMNRFN